MTQQDQTGPNAVGHRNPVTAVITALSDMVSEKGQLPPLRDDERLDGKTAMVTGANTGLGRSIAIQLAQRGAYVYLICRSGHQDAVEDIKQASGNHRVSLLEVDLSDLDSVNALADQLRDLDNPIDIAVFNAGLMPAQSRNGPQGFELMFTVHFLASRLLVHRMLADGVLVPQSNPGTQPRLIFVSSESHRSADPIDFDAFGTPASYGMKDGVAEYGRSKLHLCTYATELARQLNPDGETQIAVHSLCPGPVASDLAREAPGWAKPILGPVMSLLFRAPDKAAEPVLLLAASKDMAGRNGVYLHMMREKQVSELAADPENGKMLWEKSEALIAPYL